MWNLRSIPALLLNRQAISLIKKGTFPNLKRIGLKVASGNKGEFPRLLRSLLHLSNLNNLEIVLRDRYDKDIEDSVEEVWKGRMVASRKNCYKP
ncbi:hypothetical protein DEO72_LG2g3943 [Vigna unguiculata]|uniref:FBD domain-containing protein n=1 Tax=Vigna unguiculata TaxID=3917 RepID=A0A4D6L505_VIGUN|nr:hypothetical protein DEO72_LG2g3943 [Vigna unguiculata]